MGTIRQKLAVIDPIVFGDHKQRAAAFVDKTCKYMTPEQQKWDYLEKIDAKLNVICQWILEQEERPGPEATEAGR